MKKLRLNELVSIDEEDLPPRHQRAYWDKLFSAISLGNATVIPIEKILLSTVRSALIREQKLGKYLGFYISFSSKTNSCYVVNPERRLLKE